MEELLGKSVWKLSSMENNYKKCELLIATNSNLHPNKASSQGKEKLRLLLNGEETYSELLLIDVLLFLNDLSVFVGQLIETLLCIDVIYLSLFVVYHG